MRSMHPMTARLIRTLAIVMAAACGPVHAEDFYAGKQINLIVGSASGGGYDLLGRLMARHIVKHIPGQPTMVVQNMPAAGSLAAANHIYNVAAKDGSVIGLMQRGVLLARITQPAGVQFDVAKFNWIGSLNSETGVAFATAAAPHRTAKDLFDRELVVGATNNTDIEVSPKLYNALIGTRFKIVTGYSGTPQITLAMERGELQGIGDWSWSSVKNQRPDWLRDKTVIPLLQGALQRDRELPDLPNALDFVKGDTERRVMELYFTQKTVARPVLAPGGVPADRLALLRAAFAKLADDQDFIAEAGKQKLEVGPITGAAVDKVIQLIATAPAGRDRTLQGGDGRVVSSEAAM